MKITFPRIFRLSQAVITAFLFTSSLFAGDQTDEDHFAWQNRKHYEQLIKTFENIAERELVSTVGQLIDLIEKNEDFFTKRHKYLRERVQETAFNWMNNDILTDANFDRETTRWESGNSNTYTSDEEYGGDHEYDSEMSESFENDVSYDAGLISVEDEMEEDEKAFDEWKIHKIWDYLYVNLRDINDFKPSSIDTRAQQRFLENHVEGGYSWFINDVIEGSFSTSEDFVNSIYKKTSVPEEVLNSIFGSLWFDYDWEEFNYEDSHFLQNTYRKTLEDFISGKRAKDVKKYILKSIHRIFTFHGDDFKAPLRELIKRYNACVSKNDWRGAIIEWSVYRTYRKIFQDPAKRSKVKEHTKPGKSFTSIQSFNKETYLLSRLNTSLERTKEYYTKVYPHPTTKFLSYGKRNKATLDLVKTLSHLKQVGIYFEPHRPRDSENVFVPALYFVVSANPDQKGPKKFVRVPLTLDGLPRRPLTRSSQDVVFRGKNDNDYFEQVKSDVVTGKVLQEQDRAAAQGQITRLVNNKGGRNQELIHSERVLMELSRCADFVKQVVKNLITEIQQTTGSGHYKISGAVLCAYSTNTVCPHCTPTLLTLQNSHKEGEFLSRLVSGLNGIKGEVTFETKGYNAETKVQDWTKFHMNTFVTATTKFDPQARDLADGGLYFSHDTIDLSKPLLDEHNHPQSKNPFFYEFVGENLHTEHKDENPYFNEEDKLTFKGVVLSSGSTAWGNGLLQ